MYMQINDTKLVSKKFFQKLGISGPGMPKMRNVNYFFSEKFILSLNLHV